jgi:hypothetical protein
MIILSLDPGQTTGYVIKHESDAFDYGQCQPDAIWDLLLNVTHSDIPLIIIYERFDYRRHKMHADLTPVEVIGVIKEYVRQTRLWDDPKHLTVYEQFPSQAKSFWNDDRLKEFGMYYKGQQHARDAARHYLYWLYFGEGKTYAEIPRQSFKQKEGSNL